VLDPGRGLVYAHAARTDDRQLSRIVAIDPRIGTVGASIDVDSLHGLTVTGDASELWAASGNSIVRIDLATFTLLPPVDAGSDPDRGPYEVRSLAAVQGTADTMLVVRSAPGGFGETERWSVAVFDGPAPRPSVATHAVTSAPVAVDAGTFLAPGFVELTVTAEGVTSRLVASDVAPEAEPVLLVGPHLVNRISGEVVVAGSGARVGWFPSLGRLPPGTVVADPDLGTGVRPDAQFLRWVDLRTGVDFAERKLLPFASEDLGEIVPFGRDRYFVRRVSDFGLLGPPPQALVVRASEQPLSVGSYRVEVRDSPKAGRDAALIVFNATDAVSRAYDLAETGLEVSIGDPRAPLVVAVPAGPSGWRRKEVAGFRVAVWRGTIGGARVAVATTRARGGRTAVRIRDAELPAPIGTSAELSVRAGSAVGYSVSTWKPIPGRPHRFRFRP